MNEELEPSRGLSTREKMPTQAQEMILRILEVLSQIEKNIELILSEHPTEMKNPTPPVPMSSRLLESLKEVIVKAEYLRDSIDL